MPPKISSSAARNAEDQAWMACALALARRGEALTSPNPMVGAVIVPRGRGLLERGASGKGRSRHNQFEGFHTYDGLRHAEVVALDAAGSAARGATVYVSLEPCCHTGRTGPCTQALIAAGVARVVAAMPDPNPEVAGSGFRELRKAGIEVTTGVLAEEAQRLNEAFATWITQRRPFVTLKSALTLDGQLVLPSLAGSRGRKARRPRWITSPESRAEVQRMRHASDAILTGIGTVLADDPLLTDRTGEPRRRRLLRVVLDSHLRMSPRSQVARTAKDDVLVFTRESVSGKRAQALQRAGVEVVSVRTDSVIPRKHQRPRDLLLRPDLQEVMAELGRRNILSVLLEAGATLNKASLAAGLVDKVRLFYAPIITSNSRPRSLRESVSAPHAPRVDALFDILIERFGPDFAIEGYLRKS
jgi:diaminohydroxyphosphoribosylaminopyrimidine deaminase / 5-amino-6-(5-phosphoribosylamino)uracil reductase